MACGPRTYAHVPRRVSRTPSRALVHSADLGARGIEPSCESHCVEIRIRELEVRLTKHTTGEERLLNILEELRCQLQASQQVNVAGVEAAESELARLQTELQRSRRSADTLRESVHANGVEIQRLQHQVLTLESEREGLLQAVSQEDPVAIGHTAAKYDGDTVEASRRELGQKIRDKEFLHAEVRAAKASVDGLKCRLLPLRCELDLWDQRGTQADRNARARRDLLVKAFAAMQAGVHKGHVSHVDLSCLCLRLRLKCLRNTWILWRRARCRFPVEKLRLEALRRKHKSILQAWAWTVGSCIYYKLPAGTFFIGWSAVTRRVCLQRARHVARMSARIAVRHLWVRWCQHAMSSFVSSAKAANLQAVRNARRWRHQRIMSFLRRGTLRRHFTQWLREKDDYLQRQERCRRRRRLCQLRLGLAALRHLRRTARVSRCVKDKCVRRGHWILSALLAWHRHAAEVLRFRRTLAQFSHRWAAVHVRGHLSIAFESFRVHARWKHLVKLFQRRLAFAQWDRLFRKGILPVWRANAQHSSRLRRWSSRASQAALRHFFSVWEKVYSKQRKVAGAICQSAKDGVTRGWKLVWMVWQEACRVRRRSNDRAMRVIVRRQLLTVRAAMGVWRSTLRVRARERKRDLSDGLCRLHGGSLDTLGFADITDTSTLETCSSIADFCLAGETAHANQWKVDLAGHHDPLHSKWFSLIDDLHHVVRAAATSEVELHDAQEQGCALWGAIDTERSASERLHAEIAELRARAWENSALAGARANILQEELGNIFDEQVQLRASLRRAIESAEEDRAVAAGVEGLCSELERCLEDSGRICAELADDRRRQIRALEAHARKCQSELMTMEDHAGRPRTLFEPSEVAPASAPRSRYQYEGD